MGLRRAMIGEKEGDGRWQTDTFCVEVCTTNRLHGRKNLDRVEHRGYEGHDTSIHCHQTLYPMLYNVFHSEFLFPDPPQCSITRTKTLLSGDEGTGYGPMQFCRLIYDSCGMNYNAVDIATAYGLKDTGAGVRVLMWTNISQLAIPVTGRGGLQSCEMLRIPYCLENRLSYLRAGRALLPRKIVRYSFLLETEWTPGPSLARRIG
jgi:hypothetical protein